ncbi:Stigma-specific protein, Stig1 [Candidatus Gugararchaeum adminiculabundum]|nr:Stigma-specific protein, Stig1 [Candidatus Gugararchaeum adminiculabundum]
MGNIYIRRMIWSSMAKCRFPQVYPRLLLSFLFFALFTGMVAADSATSHWGGSWTAECTRNETTRTFTGTWSAIAIENDGVISGSISSDGEAGCTGVLSGNVSGPRMAWNIEGANCRGRGRGDLTANNISGDFGIAPPQQDSGGDQSGVGTAPPSGSGSGTPACLGTFEGTCSDCPPPPVCQQGQIICRGNCVDNNTDSLNCGRCGHQCPSGQTCQNGNCTGIPPLNCSGGLILCNGACIDTTSSQFNCGSCGNICAPGRVCQNGDCAAIPPLNCSDGFTRCNITCRNTNSDSSNCGGCGVQCPSGQYCQSATCKNSDSDHGTLICSNGLTLCNGMCANANVDLSNCGGCRIQCSSGQSCQSGKCTSSLDSSGAFNCIGGLSNCNEMCANTSVDLANCGSCNNPCAAGQSCQSGKCAAQESEPNPLTCSGGFILCNGACANTDADLSNCGSCNNQCTAGQSCQTGKCTSPANGSSQANCPGGSCNGTPANANAGSSNSSSNANANENKKIRDYSIPAAIGVICIIIGVMLYFSFKSRPRQK